MSLLKTTDPLELALHRVEGKAEIINGQIVHLGLAGAMPGRASDAILYSLKTCDGLEERGWAFGSCNGFMVDLPHRRSFCPDTGYYLGPEGGWDFFQGAPVFAVEVRNLEDYGPAAEREIEAKRVDYFAAGTLVVWDVDLLSEDVVRVYKEGNASRPAAVYRRGDTANAEPAAPGWTMPVDELFAS